MEERKTSSEFDRYKILVGGDTEIAFGLCAKLVDENLKNPRELAAQKLAAEWPEVEWTKFMSVSVDGQITTMELDLELHGPWVWELYNLMDPKDYYRRFDAALLVANPRAPDSFNHLSEFIDTILVHADKTIPIVLVGEDSMDFSEEEIENIVELGIHNDLPVRMANIESGENVDQVFRELAIDIQVDKEAGVVD